MKEKILHVVSSACYRGTLKQAFYGMGIEDEVIYLPVDFSCNYIPKDFSDTELMLSAMSIDSLELQEKNSHFQPIKGIHNKGLYTLRESYCMARMVGL